jgi:alkylation response protein AidB-like acyl-CoA dehydrogenase
MDFDDTPEEAAFRAEARAWLEAHATRRRHDQPRGGPSDEPDHVDDCKAWQRTLYDGGWAGITWPKEYGGRGGTAGEAAIFNQEQAEFDVWTGPFMVAIGMVGPTLIAHGTEAQQERFLDPVLRGDEIWCQLFSEPGAGSDLANLSTRAVADGDEFVVTGQKVWSSGAHYSDWAILLARTDPDRPKHRGITYFLLDMRTPGIDVRPLRQINGATHFNEVFLDEVRIPAANVVGAVDEGWGVTMTTLANERTAIGGGGGGATLPALRELLGPDGAGAVARQELVDFHIRTELLKYLGWRVQTAVSHGRLPGPESSVLKLASSRHVARTGSLALALQGASGMLLDDDAPGDGWWQQHFLGQYGVRIGGGTDEVQHNIIGERVLGLPREPRLDKEAPWREVVSGRSV